MLIWPSSKANFQILHQGSQTDSSTSDGSDRECLGFQFILTFVIILLSSSPSNPDSLLFSAKHWDRFHLDLDVHSYFPAYFLAHAFTLKIALGSYSYAIPNLSFGLPSFSGFYHAQLYLFNLKNLLFS